MRLLSFIVLGGYSLLVAALSLTPGGGPGIPLWDKSMHFTIYAIFAMLASACISSKRGYGYLLLLIGGYSGLLEVLQHFSYGRHMSGADLLANCLGIAFGAVLGLRLSSELRQKPL
ncbi:VanZ family protein [Halieaceae bacterium IMCC14734]|uniref:VanZ family protein n=1 Tax=Candidatus Litorirhabdus singularis TaxID=2518993 RepID=A0ABT3TL04_9GAMM|nr:VanZ family protein [Candidatus Litorirhabdus singularis]MCX2982990.1 VanZ family protein [Candidatus Litorirhabdus singularis]